MDYNPTVAKNGRKLFNLIRNLKNYLKVWTYIHRIVNEQLTQT